MNFTPSTIFDWRDRQYHGSKAYLTFRLYADGWLVRCTYLDGRATEKIEGADVYSACAFANERSN